MVNETVKVPIEVLDKRRQEGWFFGPSYFITLRFKDERIPTHQRVQEQEVTVGQYYDMEVGAEYLITMYKHSDNFYRPRPE